MKYKLTIYKDNNDVIKETSGILNPKLSGKKLPFKVVTNKKGNEVNQIDMNSDDKSETTWFADIMNKFATSGILKDYANEIIKLNALINDKANVPNAKELKEYQDTLVKLNNVKNKQMEFTIAVTIGNKNHLDFKAEKNSVTLESFEDNL